MHSKELQYDRAMRTEWLIDSDSIFRYGSHIDKPGHILVEYDRKHKIHGLDSILYLIKYGRKLHKDWAMDALCNEKDDIITIIMKSSNPLYHIVDAINIYRLCYAISEEIFTVNDLECMSIITDTYDYKALATIPVSDKVAIPNYPCTIHLVELDYEKRFIPVYPSSIMRGVGNYYLDTDNYFLLLNPIGLDELGIGGMMIALPINEANKRIGGKDLQVIKETEIANRPINSISQNKFMISTVNH